MKRDLWVYWGYGFGSRMRSAAEGGDGGAGLLMDGEIDWGWDGVGSVDSGVSRHAFSGGSERQRLGRVRGNALLLAR